MLIRTSSGNTSVGHLSHSPHGFSSLHRPDVSFSCGGLVFPVHSLLLSVSSRFFTDFFSFMRGQAVPEVVSMDAVKCPALSAVSLSYYLDFVYSGVLPDCDMVCEALELLRVSHFFGNLALTNQLAGHLATQLPGLQEEELLEVFKAAVDLKLRRLVTECLVQLLPQFGKHIADSTVAATIEHMDAELSKVVLTQLVLQGGSASALASASGSNSPPPSSGGSCCPESPDAVSTPGRGAGSSGGTSNSPFHTPTKGNHGAAGLEQVKQQFVRVLEAKGWGH